MGLESVELLLRVEEKFNIKLSDAAVSQINTVGDLHSCVLSELIRQNQIGADPVMIFRLMRDIIVEQHGIEPDRVTPHARIFQDLGID